MQLSAPACSSADTSHATLLPGGDSVSASPSSVPGHIPGHFAQLFPGLAPASSVASLPTSTGGATVATPLGVTPALRSYTPPTAAQPASPSGVISLVSTPAPASDAQSTLASTNQPSARSGNAASGQPAGGKVSRSAVRSSAVKPLDTAVEPNRSVILPTPENLLPLAPPIASEVLASIKPLSDQTEESASADFSAESITDPGTMPDSAAGMSSMAFPLPADSASSRGASNLGPRISNRNEAPTSPHAPSMHSDQSTVGSETPPTSLARAEVAARQFISFPLPLADSSPVQTPAALPATTAMSLRSSPLSQPLSAMGSFDSAQASEPESINDLMPGDALSSFSSEDPATNPRETSFRSVPVASGEIPLSARFAVQKLPASFPLSAEAFSGEISTPPVDSSVIAHPNLEFSQGVPKELIANPLTASSLMNSQPIVSEAEQLNSPEAAGAIALEPNLLARAGRAETPTSPSKAKFAARDAKFEKVEKAASESIYKNFLNADDEMVEEPVKQLGTGVAKLEPAMSTATLNDRPALAAVLPHALIAPTFRGLTELDQIAPGGLENLPTTESVASAHRAVEAVLVAADRFSSGDQHSVNLQFSVGGTDLNVRVEMRADEVRATFRTDSPELRSALAHEWQAAGNSAAGERSLRLAQPVFTSNHAESSTSLSFAGGDASSRQRDTGSRRPENEVFASIAATSRASRSSNTTTLPESVISTPSLSSRRGSHRLLTHA